VDHRHAGLLHRADDARRPGGGEHAVVAGGEGARPGVERADGLGAGLDLRDEVSATVAVILSISAR
jgi:hypothetical protein